MPGYCPDLGQGGQAPVVQGLQDVRVFGHSACGVGGTPNNWKKGGDLAEASKLRILLLKTAIPRTRAAVNHH